MYWRGPTVYKQMSYVVVGNEHSTLSGKNIIAEAWVAASLIENVEMPVERMWDLKKIIEDKLRWIVTAKKCNTYFFLK